MLYSIVKMILKPIMYFYYRLRIQGLENIPLEKPYIACANHFSAIDPVLIGVSVPFRVYCMAKAELFKNKFIGYFLRQLGGFPVKRGEVDLKSIKIALKLLGEKKVLGIFPEGTRNKTDQIIAEPGIAMLAIRAKSPVLPIALISDYKFRGKTKIVIGKPIHLDEYYNRKLLNEDYYKISYEIMAAIKQLTKGEAYGNNP